MRQIFKIATLLVFLGFFLLPKTYDAAPILDDVCCTSQSTDCCAKNSDKEETPCHSKDKKEGSKDCHECHECVSVGFFANLQPRNIVEEDVAILQSSQKTSYYLTPEFSNFDSKIWQPPKII